MSKLNPWVCRNRLITNTLPRWRPGCWIYREKKRIFLLLFFSEKNASIFSFFCKLCSETPSFHPPTKCHSGVWLSCASSPCVQRLPTWRRWDPPWAPNGCKVVYFGFPLSKYRTLCFALVPIMPTNYLLPLLAQSNQMQLIYTVSLWVFSHNRHTPLWLQGSLFIPLDLCMFRGRDGGGAQGWFPNFSPQKTPFYYFPWLTQHFVRFCLLNCN